MLKSIFCLFLSIAAASSVYAQTTLGSITGRVMDPAAASVANAKITATNTDTGVAYRTNTNNTGNYVLQQMSLGNYELAIEAAGFRRYSRKNIRLNVAQPITIDASLEIGAVEQTVEVSSEVSQLQTSTSDLGTTINRAKLMDLPLFVGGKTRDIEQFILLAPGVTGDTSNTQGTPCCVSVKGVPPISTTPVRSRTVVFSSME